MAAFIILILLHIIGDSVFLGQKLRKLKIHEFKYLLIHTGIYTSVFIVLCPLIFDLTFVQCLIFSAINGVLHLIVDYIFTLIKLRYWRKDIYAYVAIYSILEHLVHVAILLSTFLYLYPEVVDLESWEQIITYFFK